MTDQPANPPTTDRRDHRVVTLPKTVQLFPHFTHQVWKRSNSFQHDLIFKTLLTFGRHFCFKISAKNNESCRKARNHYTWSKQTVNYDRKLNRCIVGPNKSCKSKSANRKSGKKVTTRKLKIKKNLIIFFLLFSNFFSSKIWLWNLISNFEPSWHLCEILFITANVE